MTYHWNPRSIGHAGHSDATTRSLVSLVKALPFPHFLLIHRYTGHLIILSTAGKSLHRIIEGGTPTTAREHDGRHVGSVEARAIATALGHVQRTAEEGRLRGHLYGRYGISTPEALVFSRYRPCVAV